MLIRDVAIDGRAGLDVRVADGRTVEIGERLARRGPEFDGRGGTLIAGLVDHHCHLLASAARAASLQLDDASGLDDLAVRLAAAPGSGWLRATGCPSSLAERLTAELLDRWCPGRPIRVLDGTGALWTLSRAALAALPAPLPPFVEPETGRVWRGDAWLGEALGRTVPDLAPIGKALARYGITSVTDASATTNDGNAALLAAARASGAFPQRLMLMSAGPLAPPGNGVTIGPVKILLDDRDLIPLDYFVDRIADARRQRRSVAVHCVTAGELALTLAAFDEAGSRPGDRIEHGGVIPEAAILVLRRLGLTVVTQSGFIDERGDRYLTQTDEAEHRDLYRCASLIDAGVPVAGSSDSPYADWDCWRAMRTAVTRMTRNGRLLGDGERIGVGDALDLYRADPAVPGGPPRRVVAGAPADLCLLDGPLPRDVAELDGGRVAATWIAGKLVHECGSHARYAVAFERESI